MIKYSTKIENNKFVVNFDLTPKDIKCSRSNYTATHKGAGTTSRYGIWEGVKLVKVQGRVNTSSAWKNYGTNTKPSISTSNNGDTIQIKATYQIKTMGYHWQCKNGTYPFFYYGNVGGNPKRYSKGHFTDSKPATPDNNLYNIHALVPKDWKHVGSDWSDWAYKHGQATQNWAIDSGKYEQRNANVEAATSSNGWISDSNLKQQWRKSCMFTFQKEFTLNIKSSGIIKDATTPVLTVHAAKGDSGKITVKYQDKNKCKGHIKIKAYCKDKTADVMTYSNSTHFSNGVQKDITVDFMKLFGESYRGNDIKYEAWAQNDYKKESKSTGKKGGHRFNGRPSIPTGLFVKGEKDIIYNNVIFSWNASTDPDKDSLTYDIHLIANSENGTKIKDLTIATKVKTLNYKYSIANDPDNCNYKFKVRASDGQLTSNWSDELNFKKGAKPTGSIALISPDIDDTNLYCNRPRFVFTGYDGKSIFIVNINGKNYDSKNNSELFTINKNKVMFCKDIAEEKIKISGHMKNEYGNSASSATYNFIIKNLNYNIKEGEIITGNSIDTIVKTIKDKLKAYKTDINLQQFEPKITLIKANDYNKCYNALKAINDRINNAINTDTFDVTMQSQLVNVGDYNDDVLWNKLIQDIKNI